MAARFAPEPDEFDLFSPEAQQYLATPTRFAGTPGVPTRDTLADDFQLYKALGSTGDSWGGKDTTYQVYTPYGTPTQTTTTHEGGIQEGLKQFGTMAAPLLLTGGLGSALGASLGLSGTAATAVGNALVTGLATQDPSKAIIGGLSPYTAPYIGQAAGAASEALGGGTLGDIAGSAISNAAKSGLGSLASGKPFDLGESLLGGAASGASSSLVGELGLPKELATPATAALTSALLGRDPGSAAANAFLGQLLTTPATPQGFNLPANTGWYDIEPVVSASAPEPAALPAENYFGGLDPREYAAFMEANIPDPEERAIAEALAPPLEKVDWTSVYGQPTSTLPAQEMQITPENMAEYQSNLQDIYDNQGGFTSQWQTVGSDRIMPQDDGSAIGLNTETGETYPVYSEDVQRMIDAGLLNTEQSGYLGAISGPPTSAPAPAAPAPAAPAPAKAPVAAPTPSAKASGGVDLGALFGLGALGGLLAPQQKQPEYQLADVSRARSPFGSIPYSQDDLLDILRG